MIKGLIGDIYIYIYGGPSALTVNGRAEAPIDCSSKNSQWEPQLPLDGIASLWFDLYFSMAYMQEVHCLCQISFNKCDLDIINMMPNSSHERINMMTNSSFLSCEEFGIKPEKKKKEGGGG